MEADLIERHDIRQGERGALRAGARAVDIAEAMSDPELVAKANDSYLRLRVAAGLTAGGSKPVDAFDALLADLARAGAGDRDSEDS